MMYYKFNTRLLTFSLYRVPLNSLSVSFVSGLRNPFICQKSTMKTETQTELKKLKPQREEEGKDGKHIQITLDSFRQALVSEAVVTDIYQLSPTVKGYTLKIQDSNFTFYAGQWVDVFIPRVETVGGFSICSSPSLLKEKGIITLGIKHSLWPPAQWFYEKCVPGSELSLRVGGDFHLDFHDDETLCDLLLIAGGVGVNPIYSIYSHFCHLKNVQERKEANADSFPSGGKVCLLYSAKTQEELLYRSTIESLAKKYPDEIFTYYFTPNEKTTVEEERSMKRRNRRISTGDIFASLQKLNKLNTKVYICGPPSMIETVEKALIECDFPKSKIHYEKWW